MRSWPLFPSARGGGPGEPGASGVRGRGREGVVQRGSAERPALPLGRVVALSTQWPGTALPLAFVEHLRLFLDRWGLTQLVTWDLPDPQGPPLPNVLCPW